MLAPDFIGVKSEFQANYIMFFSKNYHSYNLWRDFCRDKLSMSEQSKNQ